MGCEMLKKAFNPKWYALFVETGQEDNVKERLVYKFGNHDSISFLVPKRKMRERKDGVWDYKIRTLFPGYVLLNGYMGTEEYYSMKGTPGLIKVLRDKNEPFQITDREIGVISRLVSNNEIIGISNAFVKNGHVVVTDGPLLGLDGLIESIDQRKGRVKVRLNFIGEPRLVELSVNILQTV